MTFGEWMRSKRESLGLSQEVVGARMGCSKTTIHRWETGEREPDTETVDKIADALGVDRRVARYALIGEPPPDITRIIYGEPAELWYSKDAPAADGEVEVTDELFERLKLESEFQNKGRERK